MRVALACPYAWDVPGGVQVHVRGLGDGLSARGHDVLILAPATSRLPDDDVAVVGRPIRVPYGGKVSPICASRSSWRRVRDLLAAFEPDVVHAHEPFSPSTSMFATMSAAAPVVATFHAFHERSRLLEIAAPLLRPLARRLGASIAVSEAAARFAAPVVRGRIDVVANGIDVARYAAAAKPSRDGGETLLWIGRLDRQKGFPIAVRAFAEIARRRPDARLVVAGDGRDRDAVADLPRDVRRRVRMLGAVPNDRLPGHLAEADVVVAPATGHESFGIVLVEALAAGVPVVASDIDGYREVIRDGVDGILVPPGDVPALTEATMRVLGDDALAARLRAAGPERARAFGWDRVVPAIEAIYGRALDGRARGDLG